MSDRIKELIIKTLLVIGMILLFMLFPGTIIIAFLVPDQEAFDIICNTIIFTFVGVGFLYMILLPIFGGLKPKPVKAEKVSLELSSYNQFLDFLQGRLLQKGYQMQKSMLISPNEDVAVFFKIPRELILECVTIIRISELSDELLENSNEKITDILKEYYGCETIKGTVNMISVFCVDRITSAFQKLVNSNVQQGLKNGRFLVGVSFGSNTIYMARQKDGFAIAKYKRLRREFIDIMNLQVNKKNSM